MRATIWRTRAPALDLPKRRLGSGHPLTLRVLQREQDRLCEPFLPQNRCELRNCAIDLARMTALERRRHEAKAGETDRNVVDIEVGRSTSELCTPSIEAMRELRVCVSYAPRDGRASRTQPREP